MEHHVRLEAVRMMIDVDGAIIWSEHRQLKLWGDRCLQDFLGERCVEVRVVINQPLDMCHPEDIIHVANLALKLELDTVVVVTQSLGWMRDAGKVSCMGGGSMRQRGARVRTFDATLLKFNLHIYAI